MTTKAETTTKTAAQKRQELNKLRAAAEKAAAPAKKAAAPAKKAPARRKPAAKKATDAPAAKPTLKVVPAVAAATAGSSKAHSAPVQNEAAEAPQSASEPPVAKPATKPAAAASTPAVAAATAGSSKAHSGDVAAQAEAKPKGVDFKTEVQAAIAKLGGRAKMNKTSAINIALDLYAKNPENITKSDTEVLALQLSTDPTTGRLLVSKGASFDLLQVVLFNNTDMIKDVRSGAISTRRARVGIINTFRKQGKETLVSNLLPKDAEQPFYNKGVKLPKTA